MSSTLKDNLKKKANDIIDDESVTEILKRIKKEPIPSFINPLLEEKIETITKRAIKFYPKHIFEKPAVEHIIKNANGDGRTAINAVELSASLSKKINTFS